jgi:hypothetical protein
MACGRRSNIRMSIRGMCIWFCRLHRNPHSEREAPDLAGVGGLWGAIRGLGLFGRAHSPYSNHQDTHANAVLTVNVALGRSVAANLFDFVIASSVERDVRGVRYRGKFGRHRSRRSATAFDPIRSRSEKTRCGAARCRGARLFDQFVGEQQNRLGHS